LRPFSLAVDAAHVCNLGQFIDPLRTCCMVEPLRPNAPGALPCARLRAAALRPGPVAPAFDVLSAR
jgi:hypothetical protein